MESLAQSAEWRPESSNSQGDCVAHPLPGEVASFALGKYVLGECVTPWVLKFLDPLLGACPQRYRGLLSTVFAACSSPSAALRLSTAGQSWGRLSSALWLGVRALPGLVYVCATGYVCLPQC